MPVVHVMLCMQKEPIPNGEVITVVTKHHSNSEVSSFQGLLSTQITHLKQAKVSCVLRCPHFRGVLIEGFHCIPL